jgi:hypothetical protein
MTSHRGIFDIIDSKLTPYAFSVENPPNSEKFTYS